MTTHQFDVALSFSSRQRNYVHLVAEELKASGANVFIDEDQQTAMWGRDLIEFFDSAFRQQSRYVVIFVSSDYATSEWTRRERRSALAAAVEDDRGMVLPARFDATELPELPPGIGYLSLAGVAPATLAQRIVEKLGGQLTLAPDRGDREEWWEYMLFADELEAGLTRLSARIRTLRMGVVRPSGAHLDADQKAPAVLRRWLAQVQMWVANVETLLAPAVTEAAFGADGEPGDADEIRYLAEAINGTFEGLADWAIDLRNTSCGSVELREAVDSLSQFAVQPLQQYADFVTPLVRDVRSITAQLRAGLDPVPAGIEMTLTASIPDEVEAEASRAIAAFGRSL